jgi:uncharacterized protein YbaR (Trm112 family)/SAM-dependent methyltransferase
VEDRIRLPESVHKLVCCPICRSKLSWLDNQLQCTSNTCGTIFPIVNGIPILLNEHSSVFSIDDFVNQRRTILSRFGVSQSGSIWRFIREYSPKIGKNLKAEKNYANFARLLKESRGTSRVLVIGGGTEGEGICELISDPAIELVETDVSFGPRTMLVCDAHDIPFDDESFDGVIAQAVLEHVVDPWRCVQEMHRVTGRNGLVYAETPFMQQVHMGRYDFTRFTHLGHRRLFRRFEEVDSGPVSGPGMALAWSYYYFLLSFCHSRFSRALVRRFARFTSFWLCYLDYYLIDRPGTYDAASGFFFVGRKKDEQELGDKELLKLYRGAQ